MGQGGADLLDLENSKELPLKSTFPREKEREYDPFRIHPEIVGDKIIGWGEKKVLVWNLETAELEQTIQVTDHSLQHLNIINAQRAVVRTEKGEIYQVDLVGGNIQLLPHRKPFTNVFYNQNLSKYIWVNSNPPCDLPTIWIEDGWEHSNQTSLIGCEYDPENNCIIAQEVTNTDRRASSTKSILKISILDGDTGNCRDYLDLNLDSASAYELPTPKIYYHPGSSAMFIYTWSDEEKGVIHAWKPNIGNQSGIESHTPRLGAHPSSDRRPALRPRISGSELRDWPIERKHFSYKVNLDKVRDIAYNPQLDLLMFVGFREGLAFLQCWCPRESGLVLSERLDADYHAGILRLKCDADNREVTVIYQQRSPSENIIFPKLLIHHFKLRERTPDP